MKEKAEANLLASRALLAIELNDPAMSRLYYALFQAGVHAMEEQGRRPADFRAGAADWAHGTICGNASMFRRRIADLRLFELARVLRERADYRSEPVSRVQVQELLPRVEEFIAECCR